MPKPRLSARPAQSAASDYDSLYAIGYAQQISDKVFGGKRTSKQCRARYMNHLDPDLRHDPWSLAENAALKAAADAYGGRQIKWASIVKDVKELRGEAGCTTG